LQGQILSRSMQQPRRMQRQRQDGFRLYHHPGPLSHRRRRRGYLRPQVKRKFPISQVIPSIEKNNNNNNKRPHRPGLPLGSNQLSSAAGTSYLCMLSATTNPTLFTHTHHTYVQHTRRRTFTRDSPHFVAKDLKAKQMKTPTKPQNILQPHSLCVSQSVMYSTK